MKLFRKELDPALAIWHGKRFLAAFLLSLTVISIIFKIIDSVPRGEEVVVAAKNITAGKIIGADDLQILEVSSNTIIDQTIKDPNALVNNKSVIDIYKGQIFTDNLLAGNTENLPAPAGKVPLVITLNDSSAGKIFQKGDSINILTLDSEAKKIVYLARNALILSPISETKNNQQFNDAGQQFNVMVGVTPQEAEKLAVTNGVQPLTALKA
ncbi:MAG: SAF domain-containing protein [Bifidobacteriaceae bacterium]|jgi:Flp pilus assembly protein CpaB|nr:SAF domain-containing protein [Bifidobacteriaceae bacterium]